ncbi:DeoR family transcriptional regulator [Asticcacaulis endophyticus]|uniref:DeoR family transcriptional regulator n=1 Tax=Asticcacaulis endophyticus TaxID=1395890 RepID=UPI00167B9D67|nr:DeoR family transcriptional regulator [Asticcacaulis endophyticus]
MSLAKTRRVLGVKSSVSSDLELAKIVAKALREDFGDMASAIKQIGQITSANLNTVTNWYQARNVPSSRHLLVLARTSPGILRLVLMQIGGEDLWDAFQLYPAPKRTVSRRHDIGRNTPKRVDEDVTINVTTTNLNERQSWFISELKRGSHCDAQSLANEWNVTIRTARRDISDLKSHGLIKFFGAKRNGRYGMSDRTLGFEAINGR